MPLSRAATRPLPPHGGTRRTLERGPLDYDCRMPLPVRCSSPADRALVAAAPALAQAQPPQPARAGTGAGAAAAARPAAAAAGTARPAASTGHRRLPTDYVIGPDDVLGIVFWRDADMTRRRHGPARRHDHAAAAPRLKAAGLKPDELREQITKAAAKFIEDPNVTVVVRQINSRNVFITGQVARPGAYPVSGQMTVLQLIADRRRPDRVRRRQERSRSCATEDGKTADARSSTTTTWPRQEPRAEHRAQARRHGGGPVSARRMLACPHRRSVARRSSSSRSWPLRRRRPGRSRARSAPFRGLFGGGRPTDPNRTRQELSSPLNAARRLRRQRRRRRRHRRRAPAAGTQRRRRLRPATFDVALVLLPRQRRRGPSARRRRPAPTYYGERRSRARLGVGVNARRDTRSAPGPRSTSTRESCQLLEPSSRLDSPLTGGHARRASADDRPHDLRPSATRSWTARRRAVAGPADLARRGRRPALGYTTTRVHRRRRRRRSLAPARATLQPPGRSLDRRRCGTYDYARRPAIGLGVGDDGRPSTEHRVAGGLVVAASVLAHAATLELSAAAAARINVESVTGGDRLRPYSLWTPFGRGLDRARSRAELGPRRQLPARHRRAASRALSREAFITDAVPRHAGRPARTAARPRVHRRRSPTGDVGRRRRPRASQLPHDDRVGAGCGSRINRTCR